MNVHFTIDGKASSLLNQGLASGNTITAYNAKFSMASLSKTTNFTGGLTLVSNAKTLSNTASAPATSSAGTRTASGTAYLGSFSATLKSGTSTLMTLTGTNVSSAASFTANTAGTRTTGGSAKIGGVTINSVAFGAKSVKFNGTPAANKVLFHTLDGTVVIYANRQTVTSAAGKPSKISIDAISVQLFKFKWQGKTISGNFEIATSAAQ